MIKTTEGVFPAMLVSQFGDVRLGYHHGKHQVSRESPAWFPCSCGSVNHTDPTIHVFPAKHWMVSKSKTPAQSVILRHAACFPFTFLIGWWGDFSEKLIHKLKLAWSLWGWNTTLTAPAMIFFKFFRSSSKGSLVDAMTVERLQEWLRWWSFTGYVGVHQGSGLSESVMTLS